MNTTNTLLALSACVLALAACTPQRCVSTLEPGTYEKTTNTTNADGTDVKRKETTNVTVDQYGNKRAVVKTKKTTDPKGMMNKRTTESEEVIQTR